MFAAAEKTVKKFVLIFLSESQFLFPIPNFNLKNWDPPYLLSENHSHLFENLVLLCK